MSKPLNKNDSTKLHKKSQSAMEYILSYSWAILITSIVAILLIEFISTTSTVVPTSCTFTSGAQCIDLAMGTGAQGTTHVQIVLSNPQKYPIFNPILALNISSQGISAGGSCEPNFVAPGGAITCSATISKDFGTGTLISGQVFLTYKVCQSGTATSCSSSPVQTFTGTFNTHITPNLQQTPLTLTLQAANLTVAANGARDTLVARLTDLDYPVTGSTINFTSNRTFVTLSPTFSNTGSNGTTFSYAYSSNVTGYARINATFANVSASVIIDFVPSVTVTFETSTMVPNTNATATIDGTSYDYIQLPKQLSFALDTGHTYSFDSYVYGGPDMRYSFTSTNGCGLGSAQSATFTATRNCTIEGLYTIQYLVATSSSPSNAGSTSPNTWFNSSSGTTLSETPAAGYFFTGWTGSGSGSYTGSTASKSITVNDPITEVADYIVALSTTASASPTALDVGQGTTISASPSGGSGSYTYSWAVTGGTSCPGFSSSISSSFTYSPSSSSSNCKFTVTVMDSDSETATGTTSQITVNPAVSASASPTLAVAIDVNQHETISVSPSGGSGSYSYSWAVTGGTSCPGFSSSTSSSFTYTPTSSSSDCKFTATVTDSLGGTASATTAQITVDSAVSATASPSSATALEVDVGQTISVSPSGGSGSYTYSWAITGGTSCPGFTSSTSSSFTYTPSGTSSDCQFDVTVTDTNGGTASAATAQMTIAAQPPAYVAQFTNGSIKATINQAVTWPGSQMSISFWVKYNSNSCGKTGYPYVGISNSSVFGPAWGVLPVGSGTCAPSNEIYVGIDGEVGCGSGGAGLTGMATLQQNVWYNIVGIYNSSSDWTYLYVNNVTSRDLYESRICMSALTKPYALIGTTVPYYGNLNFTGSIANVQMYNIALSPTNISDLYSEGIGGSPIKLGNLLGWWPLNGNDNDGSGNGNNGVSSNVIYGTYP